MCCERSAEAEGDRGFDGLEADAKREAVSVGDAVADEWQCDCRLGESDVAWSEWNEVGDIHEYEHERGGDERQA